jgi:Histone methylation protein DOT1
MFSSHIWPWIRWLYLRTRAVLSHTVDRALGVRTTMDETAGAGKPFDPSKKPSGWLTLYRVFHWLEVDPNDVIVDIGSGAGRAVLIAGLFPFRQVIGLERSDSLHELAKENLMRFRIRPRATVEFVLGDALDYELPDVVTVVFFYNLFAGQTFELFIQRVFASVDRSPRRLRLVYVNPKEHGYLVKTGRCRLVKRFRGLRPTREWARALATHIYEVAPHASLSDGRSEVHANHASGHFGRATAAQFQGPVLFKNSRMFCSAICRSSGAPASLHVWGGKSFYLRRSLTSMPLAIGESRR